MLYKTIVLLFNLLCLENIYSYVYLLDIVKKNFYFTDIILRLAQSSSESELDSRTNPLDGPLIEQDVEVEFAENLLAFQDTVPRYLKNKKAYRQKKKVKKDGELCLIVDSYGICDFSKLVAIILEHKKLKEIIQKNRFN